MEIARSTRSQIIPCDRAVMWVCSWVGVYIREARGQGIRQRYVRCVGASSVADGDRVAEGLSDDGGGWTLLLNDQLGVSIRKEPFLIYYVREV